MSGKKLVAGGPPLVVEVFRAAVVAVGEQQPVGLRYEPIQVTRSELDGRPFFCRGAEGRYLLLAQVDHIEER